MIKKYLFIITLMLIFYFFIFNNISTPIIEYFVDNKKKVLIVGATSEIANVMIPSENTKNYEFLLLGRNYEKLSNLKSNLDSKRIKSEIGIIDFSDKKTIDNFFIENENNKFDLVFNNYYDSNFQEDIHYQFNSNLSNNIYFLKKIANNLNSNSKLINVSSGSADILDFNNYDEILIYYSLIKNMIEKYTKILANKLYSKNIGICAFKINDSYNTQLTRRLKDKIQNVKLKDPIELTKCFKEIYNLNWSELTGKILDSRQMINNDFSKLLDSELIEKDISGFKIINKEKRYIGENPIQMSKKIKDKLKNINLNLEKYSSNPIRLINKISEIYNVDSNQISFQNGISDFIDKLFRVMVKKNHVIITNQQWASIEISSINQGKNLKIVNCKIIQNYLLDDFDKIISSIDSNTRIIYLVYPLLKNEFYNFIKKIPKNLIVIIDYCYHGFYPNDSKYLNVKDIDFNNYNKIICLFTFSKFYSLPQLQLSFSISSFEMNNMIEDFLNYPISSLKEEIGLIALDDNKRNLESFNFYNNIRIEVEKLLNAKNIKFFYDKVNYLYIKLNRYNKEQIMRFENKYFISELEDYVGIPLISFGEIKNFI